MARLISEIDANSEAFKANAELMEAGVQEYRAVEQGVVDRANGKAPRYIERGLLPPRERLSR